MLLVYVPDQYRIPDILFSFVCHIDESIICSIKPYHYFSVIPRHVAICKPAFRDLIERDHRSNYLKVPQTYAYAFVQSCVILHDTLYVSQRLYRCIIFIRKYRSVCFFNHYPVSVCIHEIRVGSKQIALVHTVFFTRILTQYSGRNKEIYYKHQYKFCWQVECVSCSKSQFG